MRHAALMLLIGALILLSACSGQTELPEPFGVPPATTSAPVSLTPEQEQLFGPRVELPGGLLLKRLGKVAQWSDVAQGSDTEVGVENWDVRVVLDSIEVDPRCDEFIPAPERGHRLLLSLRVETGSEYNQVFNGVPHYYEWSTIGPDGVSEAPALSGYSCRQADELPHEMRPSAKYRGTISVETANPAGHLVLINRFAWNYPALRMSPHRPNRRCTATNDDRMRSRSRHSRDAVTNTQCSVTATAGCADGDGPLGATVPAAPRVGARCAGHPVDTSAWSQPGHSSS